MAKILVIEDELSVRDNILELLEANNFQVTESDNGLAGIQLATQQLPDLIVCDVMMPQLDGYEVLTALRSNPATQTIPFIFLTAKASRDDWRQGMELGSDDYLTKPFTAKELLSAIATRLSKQMAIQQQSEAKLDELRSNITSALPRELQTPLNTIVGTSQTLLADYIEAAPIRSMIEDIQASGQQLSRSIQNFLLYAELELAETSSERRRTFQTYQTRFSSAIISAQAIAKAREFNRESDLLLNLTDTAVQMAAPRLQKLVFELIDNAFKFSPDGTPVTVTSMMEKNRLVLAISNQGTGMTPEQIVQVGGYMQFERKLYDQQGSGLGLTIAKRLTQFHGGEFVIESVPDKQTIVTVSLPVSR